MDEEDLQSLESGSSTRLSNINSAEIDGEVEDKLKGDLVGDTAYSQSFIIKTLLKLESVEWNKDLEDDLCFLWDTTVEKDVCEYLFKLSFPAIACNVLGQQQEPRLVEILIGILGNICVPEEAPQLQDEEIDVVLQHLNTDDHLILVQIMRFLKAIGHGTEEKLNFISSSVIEKIVYVLTNSLNFGLLENTLSALVTITKYDKIDGKYLSADLILAAMEAVATIRETCEDTAKNCTNYWLQLLLNVTTYTNKKSSDDLLEEVKSRKHIIENEFCEVISSYAESDEFDFTGEDFIFLIETLNFVAPLIEFESLRLLGESLTVFEKFLDGDDVNREFFDCFVEFLCYMISALDLDEDNQVFEVPWIEALSFIKNYDFKCEHDYVENLDCLIDMHKA